MVLHAFLQSVSLHKHETNRDLCVSIDLFSITSIAFSHSLHHPGSFSRDPRFHVPRTIQSFSKIDCWVLFRTRKIDLSRFMKVIYIPDSIVLSNTCPRLMEKKFYCFHYIIYLVIFPFIWMLFTCLEKKVLHEHKYFIGLYIILLIHLLICWVIEWISGLSTSQCVC